MEKRSNWPSVDQGIVISLGSRTNRAGQISPIQEEGAADPVMMRII